MANTLDIEAPLDRGRNAPLLSVVIACLNAGRVLDEALQSVVEQEFTNYELIVVDGGSTDDSKVLFDKYRPYISKLIRERDNGIYDAWNKGVRASSGQLVTFLGADDCFLPGAFSRLISTHETFPLDILYGDAFIDYPELGLKRLHDSRVERSLGPGCGFQTFATPRAVFDRVGLYDASYRVAGDYDFFLRCKAVGIRFTKISAPLIVFSYGGTSTTKFLRRDWEAGVATCRQDGAMRCLAIAPLLLRSTILHSIMRMISLAFGPRARRFLLSRYIHRDR